MKKPDEDPIQTEEGFALHLHPRASTPVTIQIPLDTLAALESVATSRDLAVEALLKLYVGQGLRRDLAKQFAERVLEKTARVLTRHIQSAEEVSAILKEIRVEAIA
mgnify:FL=1